MVLLTGTFLELADKDVGLRFWVWIKRLRWLRAARSHFATTLIDPCLGLSALPTTFVKLVATATFLPGICDYCELFLSDSSFKQIQCVLIK